MFQDMGKEGRYTAGYAVSTCLKQGLTASEAVKCIFQGKLPDFVTFSNIPAEYKNRIHVKIK
jgi:hypothetical protein